MFTRFPASARNFLHAEDGAVAIQLALTMVVLIGMGALAIDVGYALSKQRQMQSAADAAAFSAAVAKSTGHPAAPSTEALAVAGASGFVNGSGGVVVTFNATPASPPATAADAANASAVQVIITESLALPLIGAVCPLLPGGGCSGTFNVGVQAVAVAGSGTTSCATNCGCILQTDPKAPTGVTMSNGAIANLACGMTVNATSSTALSVTGGAALNTPTSSVTVAGGVSISNGGQINGAGACSKYCSQSTGKDIVDPYAGVTMPTQSGCANNNKTYGGTASTMTPGTYCNVSFSYGTVAMSPGVYYINSGNFSVGGGLTLTGSGVTIILGSATGTITINNGTNVTLSAPTTGPTAGIVFFGDPLGTESNINSLAGGTNLNITGALYFPTQTIAFSNGSQSSCTQLIGGEISIVGGTTLNSSNCPAGIQQIGGGGSGAAATVLVE